MPLYKYISNRLLTAFQNLFLGVKLSEYHTGFRAFSRELLETLPLLENSDDFVFDNQMIAQAVMFGFRIGEISCPTKYFEEASSINFKRSVEYGLGVLARPSASPRTRLGIIHLPRFDANGRKVTQRYYSAISPVSDLRTGDKDKPEFAAVADGFPQRLTRFSRHSIACSRVNAAL